MMITMAMTVVIPKCHDSYKSDDDEDIVNGVNANDDANDIERTITTTVTTVPNNDDEENDFWHRRRR